MKRQFMEKGNDQLIIDKYQPWLEKGEKGELEHWKKDHYGRLAFVLILDNLARNMFRGSPRAFATDLIAFEVAKMICNDKEMLSNYRFRERHFLFVSFMHQEDIESV